MAWLGGQALAAAEGVSGADHPRVAGPVMMMGGVLARTGRIHLAEGMYRSALFVLHGVVQFTDLLPCSCALQTAQWYC